MGRKASECPLGGDCHVLRSYYGQRYSQGVIDDVYKYQRDAGDRRDETYRRANYDWYGKDDN